MKEFTKKTDAASNFLKSLANKHRLLILCQLIEGEKNVTELIKQTNISQTSMSQHLKKLKQENIIDFRREHRVLYYFIINNDVKKIMNILHKIYCT